MKEAMLYKKKKEGAVQCFLCSHYCTIYDKGVGRCGVRENRGGTLYSLNYGVLVSANVDPIEKKPLYHFFPGSSAYSIASAGCNFKCGFCQNWQISQAKEAEKLGIKGVKTTPQEVVNEAVSSGCRSISYTYTEPTIYFEFAYATAKIAKEKGLYNNFVTNGYVSKEALREISPYLDAANVDLKSFRQDFYHKICGASLQPVLDIITLMKKLDIWVEITTLIVPQANDRRQELEDIAGFIASLDKNIPWHISRFHPDYKLTNNYPTSTSILNNAYQIGREKGLTFIYIGNIYTDYAENTYCPHCQKVVIERQGFFVKKKEIKEGKCSFCGGEIAGLGL